MRIAVIGAGAMGCLYAGILSKSNEVTLIESSKSRVDYINSNGIVIDEGTNSYQYRIPAVTGGSYQGKADIIIVFVKSMYTYRAMEQNQNAIGDHTVVVSLQNGAGNDRDIMKFVAPDRILVGTSKHNSINVDEGHICHSAAGVTTIGSNVNAADILHKVAENFAESGLEVEESDDIQKVIWSKLFVNLSVNAFTALMETNIGYMYQDKHAWDFARRIVYEAVEVAEADGTYFDRREALNMVKNVCLNAGEGYSSMYQDRKRKVLTEIDRINGAVVEQAKLYGVPTPYNAIIVDLIHAMEGTYSIK